MHSKKIKSNRVHILTTKENMRFIVIETGLYFKKGISFNKNVQISQ